MIYCTTLVSAFNFAPAFLHIFPIWSSKLSLQSMLIPNSFSHHQIMMNQYKNWTWKFNIDIYKVKFLLDWLLIFLNLCVVFLFRQRDWKKKFLPVGGSWLFFVSPSWWIGNEQLFNVGLDKVPMSYLFSFSRSQVKCVIKFLFR